MKTELIFLGAPASGKGTQTKRLSKELNLPHIDTGGMLRAAIAEGTEAGKTAKGFMDNGQLVPLEIVVAIIKDRLSKDDCKNGFILDGYPRSIEQAVELDKILVEINKDSEFSINVINIDVDHSVLIERIVNRRSCSDCGAIYNLKFFPPKSEGICDVCSGALVQRKDDTEETATKRIETYNNETAPLVEFYQDKGWLQNIDGNRNVDAIYNDIKAVIEKKSISLVD